MVDLYITNKQVPVVQKTEPLKSLFLTMAVLHYSCRIAYRSRKEVFQPHLPVRLPCYDLAPVTSFTLGRSLRLRTSGTPGFHGLTGGVYKARERIHRAVADARLLANPSFTKSGCRLRSELRRGFGISILSPGSCLLYPPL